MKKKTPSNRGPRLIIECSQDFKDKVKHIAAERGYGSYKYYIIALVNNDIDRITKPSEPTK